MVLIAPYGSWNSPIDPQMAASSSKKFSDITISKSGVYYWIETRPKEMGRSTVMQFEKGKLQECLPEGYSARSRVHEYGGGSIAIGNEGLYFTNFSDQKLYLYDLDTNQVHVIAESANCRYADIHVEGAYLYCVREEHIKKSEPVNTIVRIDKSEIVVASGYDFYASLALSPDKSRLAYLAWNHPNMPWDGTDLCILDLSSGKTEVVAGGVNESIFQPMWSPDGDLFFVSDRLGFWNLYRNGEALYPMEAEFGLAQWVFGMSTYAILDSKTLVCIYRELGNDKLGLLDCESKQLQTIELPFTVMTGIKNDQNKVIFQAAAPNLPMGIVQFDLNSGQYEELRSSQELSIDSTFISIPDSLDFPTINGQTVHAFFYPPQNPLYEGNLEEKPPLILNCHGGPTASATAVFNLETQVWTSRGFAVLDLNYAGSTGYGRAYRDRLKGNWGVADVADCVYALEFLSKKGVIDPHRVIIRGGSAGGFTVLRALTTTKCFQVGVSYYGVSDLEALACDTHKFESRYLEGLVSKELYKERSPIYHLDHFHSALLLLQGMEDKVVLPNQSEMMFEAVKEKGFAVAYIVFENEQHGFRQAENIQRAKEAELYFYSQVFQIPLQENIAPIAIENV